LGRSAAVIFGEEAFDEEAFENMMPFGQKIKEKPQALTIT
jgi:hypothetical protein